MTIRARVFSKDGNRFLIPGYWCDEDNEDWHGMSISEILCEGVILSVMGGLDVNKEWLEVKTDPAGKANLLNVPYKLKGQQFAHGQIDVLLISGPLFEEAMTTATEGAA